jgi:hypothetical protein
VSTNQTKILGEKMMPVASVEPRTLLGVYLGGRDIGGKKYVRFLTASGTERWADKDNVQISES